MIEIGRICVKTAGRDARKKCVIVEIIDDNYVMIDGETRRRKCNIKHLEPLSEKIDLGKKVDHSSVVSAFKKLGIDIKETKPKQKTEAPKKQRVNRKKAFEDTKEEKQKKKSSKIKK